MTEPYNDFQSMSSLGIEEELLKLDIFERFDGDDAWLTKVYDPDITDQEIDELRLRLMQANPLRSGSIASSEDPV